MKFLNCLQINFLKKKKSKSYELFVSEFFTADILREKILSDKIFIGNIPYV